MRAGSLFERVFAGGLARLYWNRTHRGGGGPRTWLDDPFVRRLVNERISGAPGRWPMDWFTGLGLGPFESALSLGCGTGALERDLRRRGLCVRILGIDGSSAALEVARREAATEGIEGTTYEGADLDRLELGEARFDAVFFHQSLHHVRELERCLDRVRSALRPGGILYVDEYVGPSRREWSWERFAGVKRVFSDLPDHARRVRRLRLPIDWKDPSEAVRSSEIEGALDARFRSRERRPYGGNLLAPLLPNLRLSELPREEHERWIGRLIEIENGWLAAGARSFYLVAVYGLRS